jgi:hypothetical protein
MDPEEFSRMADAMDSLTDRDILSAVSGVPVDWRIPDDELETLAWFLFYRKSGAASRLRALAASI